MITKDVILLLKDLGIPITDRFYNGKAPAFITIIVIDRKPFDYSDDEENGNRTIYQINFSYNAVTTEMIDIKKEYEKIMLENDFIRITEYETYDKQAGMFLTMSRFLYKEY
jgi:hypothetical protein